MIFDKMTESMTNKENQTKDKQIRNTQKKAFKNNLYSQ